MYLQLIEIKLFFITVHLYSNILFLREQILFLLTFITSPMIIYLIYHEMHYKRISSS